MLPRGYFYFWPSRVNKFRSPFCLALEGAFRLSWPGLHQAPLLGFSKIAPPSTWTREVHSGSDSSRFPVGGRNFGPLLPLAGPVPSSRFLAVLTGFSISNLAGLLHPAADPGVHRVAASSLWPRGFRILPSTMLHPSKLLPCQQPPLSSDSTLLPFAIQGWFDFRVFLRWRVRCGPLVLPRADARCSLGFLLVDVRSSASSEEVSALRTSRPAEPGTSPSKVLLLLGTSRGFRRDETPGVGFSNP